MNLTLVTVANRRPEESYYTYDQFFKSCARFGIEPVVISENYGGLGSKPKLVQRAIADGKVKTEWMIFADCFDVVLQQNPANTAEHLLVKHPEADIIWGAEKNCFPDASLADAHPQTKSDYRYLNSGLAIGKTEAFARMFERMKASEILDDYQDGAGQWHQVNDQDLIMRQVVLGDPMQIPMALDHDCDFFQNLHGVTADELDYTKYLVGNKATNTLPTFLHFNGGAKTSGLRESILQHLDL